MPVRTLGPEGGGFGGGPTSRKERVPARTLGPEGGWIVISHIGWRGERNTLDKGVETFPLQTRFKNLEGKPKDDNIR